MPRRSPDHAGSRPSRREFLQTTATAAAAVLMPREAPMFLGSGDYIYRMDHHWAKVPAGKRFGYTHGVVEDRKGRFYIANQSRDAVMVFDHDGNFLSSWGQAYAKGAHGLLIAEEGGEEVLYLANTNLAEVVKTTLEGDVIWQAGRPYRADIYTPDKPYSPTETALGPNGLLYVTDGYGQSWVHVYDAKTGKYLDSFGGRGTEPANLKEPHGIKIDSRSGQPLLQVTDRGNVRIVNFTLDGHLIEEVITKADVRYPCATFHRDDLLYIPDLFSRVSIFDQHNKKLADLGDYVDGKPLTSWDDFGSKYPDLKGYPNIPANKRLPNKFISPHALWVDRAGSIYVVEWIEDGRVTKLTRA